MESATRPTATCGNCGFELGAFPCCAQCGQRHIEGRLSLRNLVDDIRSEILEWNLPWLYTLKMLTLNPGQVALDYIHGKRTRYVNPVKYLFYVVGILALLASMLASVGDEFLMFFSGALDDRLARGDLEGMPRVFQFLLNHSALLLLVYSPIVVLAFQTAYPKAGRNLVETACFVFYLIGHLALLMFLMALAGELLGWAGTSLGWAAMLWLAGFLTLLFYITTASMVFFGRGLAYSFVTSLLQFVFLFLLLRLIPVWLILIYTAT
jgi:hypothetical protein